MTAKTAGQRMGPGSGQRAGPGQGAGSGDGSVIKARVDADFRDRVNATATALGFSTSQFIALACEEKMARLFRVDGTSTNPRGPSSAERKERAAYELALALVRAVAPAAEREAKQRLGAWIVAQRQRAEQMELEMDRR